MAASTTVLTGADDDGGTDSSLHVGEPQPDAHVDPISPREFAGANLRLRWGGGRLCKLDPYLKAPGFKGSNLTKMNLLSI